MTCRCRQSASPTQNLLHKCRRQPLGHTRGQPRDNKGACTLEMSCVSPNVTSTPLFPDHSVLHLALPLGVVGSLPESEHTPP